MRIRSILHLEGRRDANVLSHALQETVADVLRFGGSNSQQQVEGLMSEYFRHARAVSQVLTWASRTGRAGSVNVVPVPVGANLEEAGDGIRFVDPREAASGSGTWLLGFQTAIERHAPVSDQALTVIQRNVERYAAEDFVSTEPERRVILNLFRPRPGLYARLSEMHDCGLLGRIFPEFERIHSRVIRDFYHKWLTSTRC
jgi:UTP:GlnB (protein PII) uridylyltransferase